MKCPQCGAWSLVKETKKSPTFGYMRRRECANEHRFSTQEVVITQEQLDEEKRLRLEKNRELFEIERANKPKRKRRAIYRGI
jgi:transcriptional regulator NrdR family protein